MRTLSKPNLLSQVKKSSTKHDGQDMLHHKNKLENLRKELNDEEVYFLNSLKD
jgi:hypothetical protein